MEGRVLQTSRCYFPIGEAKDEWKIFRALSDNFSKKLQFNNLSQLRNEISIHFPLIKKLNMLPNISKLDLISNNKIESRIIDYNIKNFYMTDSISRSSITMSKCSQEIFKNGS